ncbi:hypothetical protein [Methylosinus sporium]|uniref:DUF4065 domain-containing protein n=1 Tax=Methylosinus sporium TaxID=428 RepID=A0A2U1SPH4_METSR|nr:hypothetical protein [Methylosinus sporium]PWB93495.1 hypothetical protein C5689_12780 [Methylosinus sporium]
MTIDIPSLIVAAGGEIVGKIRLQKVVYLLDQMGLGSGFSYEYHHYGPYSADLAEEVEDEVIIGHVESEQRRRLSDGVPYIVFRASTAGDGEPLDSSIPLDIAKNGLYEMQRRSATVLELAATIHWLAVMENRADWPTELVRRKGAKTQNGREQEAIELLKVLGLPPAVACSAG